MANTKNVKGALEKNNLPAGFEEAAPKEFWVKLVEGTIVQGILLETEQRRNDEEKQIMRIRLTADHGILGLRGSDKTEDKEETLLSVGDVVCMDVRARLSSIAELATDLKHLYEVYIKALKKVPLETGGTMWLFDVGKKVAGKREDAGNRRSGPDVNDPRFR